MPETLHTCPTCNIPNFTKKGLKTHRCRAPKAELVDVEVVTESLSDPLNAVSAAVASINSHWSSAQVLLNQSAARLILAGFELADLKKKTKHGDWGVFFRGEDKLKDDFQFEFTQQWAAELMRMAKAAKDSIPALSDLPHDLPLDQWTDEHRTVLRDSVAKRASGETFLSLAQEWGVSKKRSLPKNDDAENEEAEEDAASSSDDQKRLEEARLAFNATIEKWNKAMALGQLDDLPKGDLEGMEEFLRAQLDRVRRRLDEV